MANSADQLSSDVLFPDDEPTAAVETDSIYSQPSTYSSISREVNFDTCNRSRQPIYRQYSEPADTGSSRNSSPGLTYNLDDFMPKDSPYQQRRGRASTYSEDTLTSIKHSRAKQADNYTVPNKPVCRRDTWSPQREDTTNTMGVGASLNKIASNYHNSEQDVSEDTSHLYEHLDITGPAKLPPESGMLSKNQKKVVLRPLAFKPVVPNKYVTTPTNPPSSQADGGASLSDEGYSSNEYRSGIRASSVSSSHTAYGHGRSDSDKLKMSFDGDANTRLCDRPESSFTSSSHSRMSSNHTEGFNQTPSPSDSGVGELEAVLREKDAEICHLRETLEQNEKAIIQVYEEKKQSWHSEMDELKRDYDERIKMVQHRAGKTEQSLLLQMFKLQQERKQLQEDNDKLKAEKMKLEDRCKKVDEEHELTKSKLEDMKWNVQQKSGEISLLKSQLKESKDEFSVKVSETLSLRTQLKEYQDVIETKNADIDKLESDVYESKLMLYKSTEELNKLHSESPANGADCVCDESVQTDICCGGSAEGNSFSSEKEQELCKQIDSLKTEKEEQLKSFEEEHAQWLDEKNKVICYQKQLQLNYVQMYRKNKMLESEVEQLMLDLERRDLKYLEESMC